ncbi:MAG TPA: hypothetical protein VM260_03665, partial [Pirellula sp.]|nr:hypothetical protein [Pirellula sp.]
LILPPPFLWIVLYLARQATGLTLRELAKKVGIKRPANITMTLKRYEEPIRKDRQEKRQLAQAAEKLNVAIFNILPQALTS